MSLLLDKTRDEARRNKKIQQGFVPEEPADSPDARNQSVFFTIQCL